MSLLLTSVKLSIYMSLKLATFGIFDNIFGFIIAIKIKKNFLWLRNAQKLTHMLTKWLNQINILSLYLLMSMVQFEA